jgi:hypothetical protein
MTKILNFRFCKTDVQMKNIFLCLKFKVNLCHLRIIKCRDTRVLVVDWTLKTVI